MTRAATRRPARRRYFRITLWSVVAILVGAMVLPFTGYVWVALQDAQAQSAQESNPRANYWDAVRGGREGYSAVTGRPMPDAEGAAWVNREASSLINGSGQNWRQLRNSVMAVWGGWVLLAVIVLILLFYTIRGRIEIDDGRAGMKVQRWSGFERFVHWVTAISFVILAATGLSLIFGRVALIPIFGLEGFSVWAAMSSSLHEFIGPWIFTPGVAIMIAMWVMNNLPEKGDLEWLKKGGGIVGSDHPSAGKANAGEKLWFWFICSVGVVCIVSGVVFAFPVEFGLTRDTLQLSNLVHGTTALAWVCFWLGHAYIGTMGTDGALEGMTSGYVDVNWAKQHHDRWYAEVADKAEHVAYTPAEGGGTTPRGGGQPATSP